MYKRAAGYCMNVKCQEYAKSIFLMNATSFHCGECRVQGHIEAEHNVVSGTGAFTEVRLEFGYCAVDGIYHMLAIVKDQEAPPGRTYSRHSPLMIAASEKRAVKVAENLLASLQRSEPEEDGSLTCLNAGIISFDDSRDGFTSALAQIAVGWRSSSIGMATG